LCVLGPPPQEAAVAVEPLVKLDEPVGVVQAFVGGLCDGEGRLIEPVEVLLLLDPAAAAPNDVIPHSAWLRTYARLGAVHARLARPPGGDLIRRALGALPNAGPLLYCRKRHAVFAARSPHTGETLTRVSVAPDAAGSDAGRNGVPVEWLVWDGPAEGRSVAVYSGRGGESAVGSAVSFEQMILDQGQVVRLAAQLAQSDPGKHQRLSAEHTCCRCRERERCYPAGGGYAFAADRLVVVHAAASPPVVLPLGEWRLAEAAAVVGGAAPRALCERGAGSATAFDAWRRERAEAFEAAGPRLMLLGEAGGRALAEIARLKLALIADALAQLDSVWQTTERPHLCWNEQTIRVTWDPPGQAPASAWGFRALLRKVGLHPGCDVEVEGGPPLAYPPAFSRADLLPPEVRDAARWFGTVRGVNVYVKSVQAGAGDGSRVQVLLEDLGIARELFCTADAIRVRGEGWEAMLAPAAEQHPDDGAGLGVLGVVKGGTGPFKAKETLAGCECRWYPRFGEAVDLHALGMLLFETLLANDDRDAASCRAAIAAEREDLMRVCRTVPVEQREAQAAHWIAGRCESDAPGAFWSRRNLMYDRKARLAAVPDGLPPELWKAVVTFGLRLICAVAGFGCCPDRAAAAPRTVSGHLLPLLELRGLVALLDDVIFGRMAPVEELRAALRGTASDRAGGTRRA